MLLPLVPSYVDRASLDDHVLGTITFGATTGFDGDALRLALPPLGGAACEVWRSPATVVRGERNGIHFAHNGQVLFGAVVADGLDVEAAARRSYEAIVQAARGEGFPFLLRAWNHVRDINAGAGDAEEYKRFCAGRHEALTAAGLQKHEFPSASAVGMSDGRLAVYFIASRGAGRQIENPRQVSAYEYPRQYGRRSPSFARATAARFDGHEIAFISGTASVVGHETRHPGDSAAQLEETIVNLEHIIAESGATAEGVRALKVYVRRGAATAAIEPRLAAAFPSASMIFLESDICRHDLLLEIEAIALVAD